MTYALAVQVVDHLRKFSRYLLRLLLAVKLYKWTWESCMSGGAVTTQEKQIPLQKLTAKCPAQECGREARRPEAGL